MFSKSNRIVILLLATGLITAPALATMYDDPWLPDWSGQAGYTTQTWELAPVDGAEPGRPLSADVYSYNTYGDAAVSWSGHSLGYTGWVEYLMGSHPSWATGCYGGMVDWAKTSEPESFDFSASVATGSDEGLLVVMVQYDWYAYVGVEMTVAMEGATEITPDTYYDYEIARSGSDNPWMRTTQIFEFDSNPGVIDLVFDAEGFATGIDSLTVMTAVGDASSLVPATMIVPEPATVAILGLGVLLAKSRRKK